MKIFVKERIFLSLAILLFMAFSFTEGYPDTKGNPASFEQCTDGTLKYWLYIPENAEENMPLIVYLHGGSGKGDDLNLITSVDGFPKYLKTGKLGDLRAFVIMPQCPSSYKGWINANSALYSLIKKTVSQFKIDEKNISLTGHSMGGTGSFSLAAEYPSIFSRVAPLSGSVRSAAKTAVKLKNTPIWAFVGSEDNLVPPENSINFIKELKKSNPDAKITVFEGADHFSVPERAYLNDSLGLIDWLIEK